MKNKKSRNLLIAAIVSTMGIVAFGAFVTSIGMKNVNAFLKSEQQNGYTLNLNSSNAVSSSGTHTMYSTTSGAVRFDYTNVSASSGNHCAITAGGTIVNKDVIHSISSFVANFSGSLQARIGYSLDKMNNYFDLVSGQKITLGSNPYYLELKSNTNVVLSNAIFEYTCEINEAAEAPEVSGSYDIVFKKSSDSNTALGVDEIEGQIQSGNDYISLVQTSSKIFPGEKGLKFGSSKSTGDLEFNLDSTKVTEKISTISLSTAKYGSDGGEFKVYVNGSNQYTSISPSSGGTVVVNDTLTSLEIETSSKRAYLAGLTLNYNAGGETPTAKADEVGFTAKDANKTKYTSESIFDNDNALSVMAMFSDGTFSSLPLGTNGYSFVVKDSKGVAIDTSKKFGEVGEYTIVVSYKNYIPVEINLDVSEYKTLVDVSANMKVVNFNTSDSLEGYLNDNLSAILSYSNSSTKNIQYPAFAEEEIEAVLLTPRGINHDFSVPFGVAGEWTLVVQSTHDENIRDEITLNVAAILVETITLNYEEYNLEKGEQIQLVATVNPTNATNSACKWESNNDSVATVSSTGLVTAVDLGSATIICTSKDGTAIVASCVINVSEQSTPTGTGDFTNISYSDITIGQYIIFTSDNYGTVKAMADQKTNNRGTASVTISNDKIVRDEDSEFVAFEVRAGKVENSFAFYDPSLDGYLCAAGATSKANTNYLRTEQTLTNLSSFKVEDGELVANASGSNTLRFNPTADSNKGIFSCYQSSSTTMAQVYLFANSSSPTPVATPIYPTSIEVSGDSPISIGQTTELSVSYEPNNTNVKNVTFSSSDTSIATVSNKGIVTGVSAGSATITATAQGENGTITDTFVIQVKSIAVDGVSLDSTSINVNAGKTVTLVATVSPTNATNKSVTWSTSDSGIATVSDGVIKGISAGNATITVATVDGGFTATCLVTVKTASISSTWQLVTDTDSLAAGDVLVIAQSANGVTNGDISSSVFGASKSTFSSDKTSIESLGSGVVQLTLGGEEGAWTLSNDNGQLLGATAVKKLAWDSGTTKWSIRISGGDAYIENATESYGKILYNTSSPRFTTYTSVSSTTMPLPQLYRGGTAEPTDPTSISLNETSVEVAPGGSKNIIVSYNPKNANQNKEITWSSNNESVATVDNGNIKVSNNASVGATATITATLTNLPSIKATCNVKVIEKPVNDQTVLIYLCGADLESKNKLATGDIKEILSIYNQPEDVNIVIETGGASSWATTYGISSSYLERYHVANRKLVKDETLSTYTSMGQASTLRSFIEYGLKNYPADRVGLILWNHGGGMRGVCYDEKKSDDSLKASEVKSAVSGALTNCGMSNQKLEWIGYDACLMAVQDVAEINSKYFNYMIASEESEAGYGWDYDSWVDDLYSKKDTRTILKSIVDGFIYDNGGSSSSGDQTLSYMDLSKASAYLTAWENMASALKNKITSSNRSTFNSAITGNVKHYADEDYDYFCTFDALDFVNKLASSTAFSSFRIDSSLTNAVSDAHDEFVVYSVAQKGAGNSYGICMYWPNSTRYSDVGTYYTTSETNFSIWRNICVNYGYYA